MSRRERFTPYEKEQACLDYINGNRSRSEIWNCLQFLSSRNLFVLLNYPYLFTSILIIALSSVWYNNCGKRFRYNLISNYLITAFLTRNKIVLLTLSILIRRQWFEYAEYRFTWLSTKNTTRIPKSKSSTF